MLNDKYTGGLGLGANTEVKSALYNELNQAEIFVQLSSLTGNTIYLSLDIEKLSATKSNLIVRNPFSTWNSAREKLIAFIKKESNKCG